MFMAGASVDTGNLETHFGLLLSKGLKKIPTLCSIQIHTLLRISKKSNSFWFGTHFVMQLEGKIFGHRHYDDGSLDCLQIRLSSKAKASKKTLPDAILQQNGFLLQIVRHQNQTHLTERSIKFIVIKSIGQFKSHKSK